VKPRKPSRKAKAGPKSYLLTGQPTPEQAAELAGAFRKAMLRMGRQTRPLEWLSVEIVQLKEAGKIPTGSGARTKLAKLLEQRMVVAVQAGKCSKAISWESIRARLYEPKLSALLK
jgi:hypothetical protein